MIALIKNYPINDNKLLGISLYGLKFIIYIFFNINFIEQNKKLFFTKKMLGYPMIEIYGKFIALVTLSQLILFFVLKAALNMPWNLWLLTSISFLIVDFIIMWITAVQYQKTLTKSVLKGEEL